jgi:hypothetical protein
MAEMRLFVKVDADAVLHQMQGPGTSLNIVILDADLRMYKVSMLGELGIAPHLIEAVVNHISGSKTGVASTYNRSQLVPERKASFERWAAHIAGLVNGGADNALHPRQGDAA